MNFKGSLYILDNNLVSDVTFANIVSVTCLLIILTVSLADQFPVLIECKLSIISFVYCVFSVSKMTSSYSKLSRFSPMVFSRSFTVLCFAMRSMTCFEGNFCEGCKVCVKIFCVCVESKSAHFFHLHLHFSLKGTLDSKLAILSQWAPQVLKKMLLDHPCLVFLLLYFFFRSCITGW